MLQGGNINAGLRALAGGLVFLIGGIVLQFNVRSIIAGRAESLEGYPPATLRMIRIFSLGMDPAKPSRSLYICARMVCAVPILLGLTLIAIGLFVPSEPV